MEFKILWLYHDMLDLYGDKGNIEILKYRLEKRNIECIIDKYSIGDSCPNFVNYDMVFIGGGADNEQVILSQDLLNCKENIKNAYEKGVFFLLICGGYQMFGKYYKDANGKQIQGLEIFDYYTVASTNKNQRCIGNIIINAVLQNKVETLIGFENHGGQTFDVKNYFGEVLYGNGNQCKSQYEGFFVDNVIGTYLHGPLLSKNPELADYIIKYAITRKYNQEIELVPIDDEFENSAKQIIINRYFKK